MALSKEAASAVIAKYGANEHDTGNTKVQVALLTERIQQLTEHERAFPKDKARAAENRRREEKALEIFRADESRSVPLSYQRARYP